jgi:hypothetical protein
MLFLKASALKAQTLKNMTAEQIRDAISAREKPRQ